MNDKGFLIGQKKYLKPFSQEAIFFWKPCSENEYSGTWLAWYIGDILGVVYYGTFLSFLAHKHWCHLGPVHMFELKGLLDMMVFRKCL